MRQDAIRRSREMERRAGANYAPQNSPERELPPPATQNNNGQEPQNSAVRDNSGGTNSVPFHGNRRRGSFYTNPVRPDPVPSENVRQNPPPVLTEPPPVAPEPPPVKEEAAEKPVQPEKEEKSPLSGLFGGSLSNLLSGIESDKAIVLALLFMLSKEEKLDFKLLLAVGYILI